jgi:hypothetical protein
MGSSTDPASAEEENEFFEHFPLKVVQHFFLHEFEGKKGIEPLLVRSIGSERVEHVGDTADAPVRVDFASLEAFGVAGTVLAFMVLHDDDLALFRKLICL